MVVEIWVTVVVIESIAVVLGVDVFCIVDAVGSVVDIVFVGGEVVGMIGSKTM